MQMINVSRQILLFRKFLLDSWGGLDQLMEDHDWEDDGYFTDEWLQVNWEFLVERQLLKKNGYLNSYGIFYKKARVTNPTAKITHLIVCKPKPGKIVVDCHSNKPVPTDELLIFHCLYKKDDTYPTFGLYPPFDYAGLILSDLNRRFENSVFGVTIDTIDFFLCAIDDIEPKNPDDWYLQ